MVCRKLLTIEPAFWTFAAANGVLPHNNTAATHGVISRKTSHGTDREACSGHVEAFLTGVATCCQWGRDVLGFLTECLRVRSEGRTALSLLA